jgi:hypothetical protein
VVRGVRGIVWEVGTEEAGRGAGWSWRALFGEWGDREEDLEEVLAPTRRVRGEGEGEDSWLAWMEDIGREGRWWRRWVTRGGEGGGLEELLEEEV